MRHNDITITGHRYPCNRACKPVQLKIKLHSACRGAITSYAGLRDVDNGILYRVRGSMIEYNQVVETGFCYRYRRSSHKWGKWQNLIYPARCHLVYLTLRDTMQNGARHQEPSSNYQHHQHEQRNYYSSPCSSLTANRLLHARTLEISRCNYGGLLRILRHPLWLGRYLGWLHRRRAILDIWWLPLRRLRWLERLRRFFLPPRGDRRRSI